MIRVPIPIPIPIPGMMRNYMPFQYIPSTNNVIKDTLTPEQIKYIEEIIIAPYVKKLNDSISKGIMPTITKDEVKKLVLADLGKILTDADIKKQCDAINLKLQEELAALKLQLTTLEPSIANIKIDTGQLKTNINIVNSKIEELSNMKTAVLQNTTKLATIQSDINRGTNTLTTDQIKYIENIYHLIHFHV